MTWDKSPFRWMGHFICLLCRSPLHVIIFFFLFQCQYLYFRVLQNLLMWALMKHGRYRKQVNSFNLSIPSLCESCRGCNHSKYYSQAMSSVPPKIPFMTLLVKSWIHWWLQISDSSLHSCMHNEPWIPALGSYDISTSSVSLNLMWMSSKKYNPFKDFLPYQMQRSFRKYSLLTTTHAGMLFWILTLVSGMTNRFIFQIINSF